MGADLQIGRDQPVADQDKIGQAALRSAAAALKTAEIPLNTGLFGQSCNIKTTAALPHRAVALHPGDGQL